MSIITAVQPYAIIDHFDYRPITAPVVHNRRSDRDHRRDEPLDRRSCAWEHQFAEVVQTRLPRLQRLARRILHSEDMADDAVQEALFSLWKGGRMPPNVEGWLVRAVVLRSLHLHRCRRRRRRYEERASTRRPESDPCGDASRVLESQEFARVVTALLRKLPEHLGAVFVLREGEERDYESIAATLGVPVGTVRSRLHRAREALRDSLRTLAYA
jgi:RNA polymerase sigma factor (sigma-70 family)